MRTDHTPQPSEPNSDEVVCPACVHQFRAIPVNVQRLLLDSGHEPPFTERRDAWTADQIAKACADVDISDSSYESLMLALHYTAPAGR